MAPPPGGKPGGAPPPPASMPMPAAPRAASPASMASASEMSHLMAEPSAPAKQKKGGLLSRVLGLGSSQGEPPVLQDAAMPMSMARDDDEAYEAEERRAPRREQAVSAGEDATGLLSRQLASGLWAGSGEGSEPVRQARATALALLELLRQGITSNHPLHGAQVKKAVEALLALAGQLTAAPEVAELALGVAWLVAAGPRTRGRIAQAAQPLAGLSAHIGNEVALRQHVDALASR